jgi:hypothetical protein
MRHTATYSITYTVKKLNSQNGEFTDEIQTEICRHESETNEIRNIFTDLFFLHRGEQLTGLEIISVEKKEKPASQIFLKGFSFREQIMECI